MITIKEHPYKVQCDLCSNKDTFMIAKDGIPASMYPIICRNDLKEIVEAGTKLFDLSKESLPFEEPEESRPLTDDLIKQLEAKDAEIEILQKYVDKLEKLMAVKKRAPRQAHSASSMKGV